MNKISDERIWDAYRRFMLGESLTRIAKDINLDRGTLKKYIQEIVVPNLSEEEHAGFENKINKNFRGNSNGEGRKGRNKKEKALKQQEYIQAKQKIQEYELSDESINQLYEKLANKKNTRYAQDTYIIKLSEFLDYFVGKGLSAAQVIEMLNNRPQIFTADIKTTINSIIESINNTNKDGIKELYKHSMIITVGKKNVETYIEQYIEKNNMENGSDKDGRIFTNDAEIPGDEK